MHLKKKEKIKNKILTTVNPTRSTPRAGTDFSEV